MAAKGITLPIIYKSDDSGLKQAQKSLDGFGKTIAGIGAAIAGAFAINKISDFARESILAAEGVATANARIEQIAKSTNVFGNATSQVTDRLIKLAEANEMVIATDAEVIKGVQGQLLSFKALAATATETGGAFDVATMAAFNMAAAGFGSAESNAVALGKALEDPIRGLTALRRSGTTFTAEQQEQIRVLQESGDLAGAQAIILAELESQYGGVAAATANASEKLALAADNIKENVGGALLPIFANLVTDLIPVFDQIGEALAGSVEAMAPTLQSIAGQIPGLIQGFIPMIPLLGQIGELFLQLVAAALPFITQVMAALMPVLQALLPVLVDAISTALQPLLDIFLSLVPALAPLAAELLPMIAEAFAMMAPMIANLIVQLLPMVSDILPVLAELFLQILKAVLPLIEAVLPVLMSLIVALAPVVIQLITAFMPLIELILPILIGLIEFLVPIIEWLAELFSMVMVKALGMFIGGIENAAAGISTFTTFFQDTFTRIRSFFATVINSLIAGFEGFVNGAIRGINTLISSINRLQWKVPSWVKGIGGATFGFNFPTIPEITLPRVAFAEGGIVTGPVTGLVGEAGPEAIIPLDKFDDFGGPTYNITVNAGVGDPVRIGQEIVTAIKRYEKVSGPVFASA